MKYFDVDGLDKFLIICPARDINKLESLLHGLINDDRFSIVDEKIICPELDGLSSGLPGWYIQQILKISAAKHLKTKFYLTLDSDVICKKYFSLSSLTSGARAYTNIEYKSDYDEIYTEDFSKKEWKTKNSRYVVSAKILSYQRREQYVNISYGETPVLLHTQSVNAMVDELSNEYDSWVKELSINKGWTEYALYFLYMEKYNILEKYHKLTGRNTILDLDSSIWHVPEKYKYTKVFSLDSLFHSRAKHGYFVVVQSYLDSDKWLPENYRSTDEFYTAINDFMFPESEI